MGNNSEINSRQRRTRCWGIFRRRFPNWSEQVSATMLPSPGQEQDGNAAASDAPMNSQRRYTPYAIPLHHWRRNLPKQDKTHVNVEGEKKSTEKRMESNRQVESVGHWFKITIPFGIKYDGKWLLNLIQSQCSVPFTPVEFHYEKMQAHFFVDNASIAFELKNISEKIMDENDEQISIFVSPSDVPCSVQEPKSEKTEQIELTMNKQCDASQQGFNVQRLSFDQDLLTHTIQMTPNPTKSVVTSLNTHEENMSKLLSLNLRHNKPYQLVGLPDAMPVGSNIKNLNVSKNEVKFAGKMDKEKGLEPEQICTDIKALCTISSDKASNINSILELFPKLLSLGGQESSGSTVCGSKAHKSLPICKGSFFGSEMLKSLLLQFLQQYYLIYDYGDRQGLLSVYHDEACFSLTILVSCKDSTPSTLCEYFKYSRNMKLIRDSYVRRQLLKHTKHDVVHSLCLLPKTRHDFHSFVVDMWSHTETMVCFSVNGVFKEVEGRSLGCVRTFTRNFIAVPGSSSILCIVNDKLFMKNTIPQGTQSAFFIPMSSGSETTLSQEQQDMVQAFSIQSGMDLKWSQKFLQGNQWNYSIAAQVLALSKAKGKISEETLRQTDPRS